MLNYRVVSPSKHVQDLVSQYLDKKKIPIKLERMLSARTTNLYNYSDVYNAVYKGQSGDKDFYTKNASFGKVLYLGVGSGRIFRKISKINNEAYGLDQSLDMTKHLDVQKEKIILANVLNADLPHASFDKIIAPYCFLNQFEYDDAKKILENCFNWLRPGGILITDFFSPYKNPSKKNLLTRDRRQIRNMTIESFELYDFLQQKLLELTFVRAEKYSVLLTLPLYYYFPNEILRLAREMGFQTKLYGDFNKNQLSSKSDIILIESRKVYKEI